MDRLGFLKSLGILAGASLIPDWAVPAENVIPLGKGLEAEIDKQKFVNNMSIQRKTYIHCGRNEMLMIGNSQDKGFYNGK